MFGLRRVHTWTFVAFSLTLMQPILLFFLSALVLPDFDRDEALDLRANYFAQMRWFFGMMLALLLASLARCVVIGVGCRQRRTWRSTSRSLRAPF